MEPADFQTLDNTVSENEAGVVPPHEKRSLRAKQVIEVTVSAALGVSCLELQARTRRTASIAFARQVAMYLAHVVYGMSLTQSGQLFGRDRTTAAHACCIVEDKRDDPAFDKMVEHLEKAVLRLQETSATVSTR